MRYRYLFLSEKPIPRNSFEPSFFLFDSDPKFTYLPNRKVLIETEKKIERPQEEWQIFKDTHPAIIDRETFALVQELRSHRVRPTRTG